MSDYACTTHHCSALDARNEYRVKFRNKENIGNTHTGVTARYLHMSSAMVLMAECHQIFFYYATINHSRYLWKIARSTWL
jgi:hypothetical protein